MKLLQVVFMSFVLVGCSTSPAADASADERRWQGIWTLVSATYNGAPRMDDVQWVVSGNQYTVRVGGAEETWMFKLDAGRKEVEAIHHTTPPETSGGKLTGIYEVTDDSLRVCYDLTGRRYPASFDARRGSRQVLYRFQRK